MPIVVVLVIAACGGGGGGGARAFQSATIAGGSTSGSANGPVATATFNNPTDVAADVDGSIYVCDFDNNLVRKIKNGVVTTLVSQANFAKPFGATISPTGQLYVSTDDNATGGHSGSTGTIWKVDKTTGVATVLAHDIGRPRGLTCLLNGTIVAANLTRNVISLFDPTTGAETVIAGEDGVAGSNDGTGAAAHFSRPYGCCTLATNVILVADQNNNKIRQVTQAGVVTTYAGTGAPGKNDAAYLNATFNGPQDVKLNPMTGDIFVADTKGLVIRRLQNGRVTTVAGNGIQGFVESDGTNNEYYGLEGISISGDGTMLIIADGNGGQGTNFNRIRSLQL